MLLTPIVSSHIFHEAEKRYRERAERFCQNLMWRRITGNVNPQYVYAAIEGIFTAAEVIDEMPPAV